MKDEDILGMIKAKYLEHFPESNFDESVFQIYMPVVINTIKEILGEKT